MKEVITTYKIKNPNRKLLTTMSNIYNEYWGYYDNPEQWCVHIKFEDNPYKEFLLEVIEFEYNTNIPEEVLRRFLYEVENDEVDILSYRTEAQIITKYFYAYIENEDCPLIKIFNMRKVDDEPYLYQATRMSKQ